MSSHTYLVTKWLEGFQYFWLTSYYLFAFLHPIVLSFRYKGIVTNTFCYNYLQFLIYFAICQASLQLFWIIKVSKLSWFMNTFTAEGYDRERLYFLLRTWRIIISCVLHLLAILPVLVLQTMENLTCRESIFEVRELNTLVLVSKCSLGISAVFLIIASILTKQF